MYLTYPIIPFLNKLHLVTPFSYGALSMSVFCALYFWNKLQLNMFVLPAGLDLFDNILRFSCSFGRYFKSNNAQTFYLFLGKFFGIVIDSEFYLLLL